MDPMTHIGLVLFLMCVVAGIGCIVVAATHSMYQLWRHRRMRRSVAVRYAKHWSTDQSTFDGNRTIR